MYMLDFVYGDEQLSHFDSMVAYVNKSANMNISMGSKISRDSFTNHITHKFESLRANYQEPITVTFDIVKKDCDNDSTCYTDIEMRHIMRWLNQKTDKKFMPLYDDISFNNVFYYGTFTSIESIVIGGNCVGFTLVFESNSPFGYEECLYSGEGTVFNIENTSDEIGITAIRKAEIEVKEAGSLLLSNSLDTQHVLVNNCVAGEILTFDGEHLIIKSNKGHTKLFNDFNYNFPRLVSEYDNTLNIITSSIHCKISLTYDAIRKVGVVV